MTNEQYKVKEYLSSLRRAQYMVNTTLDKIEELEALANRVSLAYEHERVQGGIKKNVVEDTAIKVVMYSNQLKEDVDKYIKLSKKIDTLIDSLDDQIQQTVLKLRFVHYKSVIEVARIMHYEERQIIRITLNAINYLLNSGKFEEISTS